MRGRPGRRLRVGAQGRAPAALTCSGGNGTSAETYRRAERSEESHRDLLVQQNLGRSTRPERIDTDESVDAPVELLDLTPTICELAGVDLLRTCEGRGLLPLLERPASPPADWRDAVYSELRGEFMIRTTRHKYVYRVGETLQELFDLAEDPCELRNLSGEPSAAAVERELHDRLLEWLATTNRPLTSLDLQPGELDDYRVDEIRPLRA